MSARFRQTPRSSIQRSIYSTHTFLNARPNFPVLSRQHTQAIYLILEFRLGPSLWRGNRCCEKINALLSATTRGARATSTPCTLLSCWGAFLTTQIELEVPGAPWGARSFQN